MGLSSCVKHYTQILDGCYNDFDKQVPTKENWQRQYTPEQFNSLFDNIDEIEIEEEI